MVARVITQTDDAPTTSASADVLATLAGGRRGAWKRALGWLAALVMVAGLIAGLVIWRARDRGPDILWETVPAERGDIAVTIEATGSLEPEQSVTVGAEVSGKIATVEVDEDDRVERGQVLARFDLVAFENELAEATAARAAAKAEVQRAAANLRERELQLSRTRRLAISDVASAEQLEEAETGLALATADLAHARAQRELAVARVEQITTKIDKAVVRAPIAGVVLRRAIEPGSTVAATFQTPELFTIAADLARMTLELAIDEADVGQIAVGQHAHFVVDAWPDRQFGAELTELHLSPEVSGSVVTYVAELAVDNREGLLRPGMTATATIEIGTQHDVLRIPIAALRFVPPSREPESFRFGPPVPERRHASGSSVWVLRAGQPVRLPITTGASNEQWIAVVGGELEVGDAVLIGAQTKKPER